jgi:glycine/D-amino acid oxidase-like deaminating enzyme
LQTELGADIHLLTPDQMKARFPRLHVDGLAGVSFGQSGEGWLDPNTLPQVFRAKARAMGATYIHGEATKIHETISRIEAVDFADSTTILCRAPLIFRCAMLWLGCLH